MPSYLDHFGTVLKTEDLRGKPPARVVIEGVAEEKVQNDSGTEKKLVMRFIKRTKGLVLNRINGAAIAEIAGTADYEQWSGTPVILYVDETVVYQGKRVGGIRVKAATPVARVELPEEKPAVAPPPSEPAAPMTDDDIPFAWLLPLVLPMLGVASWMA